jgi:hypothetical protein
LSHLKAWDIVWKDLKF